ncbi:hypothetical protein [Actinomadura oligospora]|uniref:hypothetical protein n=1 Tax=Actinomadura oligospora TaxID=111804 RepID=UPI001B8027EA|nr:hypothetical protein [Actinomadura oligospora]
MTNPQTGWTEWLATLPQEQRATADGLLEAFTRLGADAPGEWARSEVAEGLPQLARFLLLRQLWTEAINGRENPGALENVPAAARLVSAGADRGDVVLAMRAAAFEAVFATLLALDEGGSPAGADEMPLPGWRLHETDSGGRLTGRCLNGLQESLRETDPSGHDAQDIWT